MKKILITGAGSYIGTSFAAYLAAWPQQFQVDTLDMREDTWRETSFTGCDCVFHVAGIAHIRETEENAAQYYRVNRDLAVETARKAKAEGVPHFIFMSTMSVYGIEEGPVDPLTPPNPKSHYGKAKLQAEEQICQLRDGNFAVAVLRPPMVYGPGCKGNYQHLVKFARYMPLFPDYQNRRSMLSMENLARFLKTLVEGRLDGLFCPQDEEYVCTCRMVRKISEELGRPVPLVKLLNPAVSLARHTTRLGRKAFGDLYYTRPGEGETKDEGHEE